MVAVEKKKKTIKSLWSGQISVSCTAGGNILEKRKEKKREKPSCLALKVATADKHLAQEHHRRNPGALAAQTTS